MNLLRLTAAGLLLLAFVQQVATAQALDPGFAVPTSLYAPGTTFALGPQQPDGKRLVAGNFTRINGTPVSRLVRLAANGSLDVPFTQNVGTASNAFRVRQQPNGQYLLFQTGGPLTAGGITRNSLLRLNGDGTGDASFNAGTGPFLGNTASYILDYAVQANGKVLVVGRFDSFNNVPAAGIVRLNTDGSVDPGFSVGSGFDPILPPEAVVVQPDGKILVGGQFSIFNGQPAIGVVRLNTDGSLDAGFTSLLQTGRVRSLTLQPDGKMLAVGEFSASATAGVVVGVLRLLPSGAVDPGFTCPAFLRVLYIFSISDFDRFLELQPDGKILLVGSFIAPSGAHGVARLNADGSFDGSFQVGTGTGANSSPTTLGLQASGSVLVGGRFETFNGLEANLAHLNSTGAPDPTFAPLIQRPGSVTSMVQQADGRYVLGGSFTEINGQPVHRLVRLNTNGSLDASYSAAVGVLPSSITNLALQPDGMVLASTYWGLFRFTTSGSRDPAFMVPNTEGWRMALQPDGRILTASLNRVSRFLSNGQFDNITLQTMRGSIGSIIYVNALLVQPDGRIIVSGLFNPTGQASVNRVVRYEADGTLDASFNNLSVFAGGVNSQPYVGTLALQPDGKLLVGGNFDTANNAPHYGVARLHVNGTLDTSFGANAPLSGAVYALAPQPNGRILFGGSFSSAAGNNLGRLLNDAAPDASFTSSATPGGIVSALLVQADGKLMVAGSFTTIGGQRAVGVARLTAPNVLAVAAPAAVASRTGAWPVPAHGVLHVAPDAGAQPQTLELLDALGRSVRRQPATGAATQTLDLQQLPAGVYLLRVSYAAGAVTRRIVVE